MQRENDELARLLQERDTQVNHWYDERAKLLGLIEELKEDAREWQEENARLRDALETIVQSAYSTLPANLSEAASFAREVLDA